MHLLLSLLIAFSVSAGKPQDSPITSTEFWTAYNMVKPVAYASEKKTLDARLTKTLLSRKIPVDQKAAIINAIGWSPDGNHNADTWIAALKKKYKTGSITPESPLSADEFMCLGYLLVMDDYFQPQNALPYLEQANKLRPGDYTLRMILALTLSQRDMDSNWCLVYRNVEAVQNDKSLRRNLRPEATDIIMDYINLYQESCQ
jgi:hypothetical protein